MQYPEIHHFHIPVMGIAFTIDSPIKVAKYGISSVISIVEDKLIEMMREYYYPQIKQPYIPISKQEPNYRANRITDYLNLVNSIVQTQIEKIKKASFEKGSEIVKYFELLPDDSMLKKLYLQSVGTTDLNEKIKIEEHLRNQVTPGSIDVNIMTKIDRDLYKNGEIVQDESEALEALKGYANSNLKNSSVIFSAGMNPRLYNYLANLREFEINKDGTFNKKVIVKVSDYRSALIQGKYLAKKGVWVSEFRIESGINCGGHAFVKDGVLLGPILEEFKINKRTLVETLFEYYNVALLEKNKNALNRPPIIKFSVQGGIGEYQETQLLRDYFNIDSTGWGTPFLLVPEATTVDSKTLELLCNAKQENIFLSNHSPLGVKFHYLKNSSSDIEKKERIMSGKFGSPCTEKHLALNTEFTKEPICTASKKYQKLKLEQLKTLQLDEQVYQQKVNEVLEKECLCIGLSNSASLNYNVDFVKPLNAVTICPGPNIVNFSKQATLKQMVDHIYGRTNLIKNSNRVHMFIAELYLYIDYWKNLLEQDFKNNLLSKNTKNHIAFFSNLKKGIRFYESLKTNINKNVSRFAKELACAEVEIDYLNYKYAIIQS